MPLQTVEVQTGEDPSGSVIWLHGLGADAHDFEPIVPDLVGPGERALRFVFPNAPVRAVTINGGIRMRAWYDVLGFDRSTVQDEQGIRASYEALCELVRRELERGIPAGRVVLAGFSQGGAMALFTGTRIRERLAGIIGLSCYLPLGWTLPAERQAVNQTTPILMAHGEFDPVVDASLGRDSRDALAQAGYAVQWHSYPMGHEVCSSEIAAIAAYLASVL